MELYNIFSSKIPRNIDDFHPSKARTVTFLNPYSYSLAEKNINPFKHFDIIAPDGILVVRILNSLKAKKFKVNRFSFDMTSVAPYVLKEAEKNNYDVYFLGTKEEFIEPAVKNFREEYPNLIVAGYRHGYFKNRSERNDFIHFVVEKAPKIIIIGMGTPIQEKMALELKKNGFKGAIYTCGGFLHQTSNDIDYYPRIVDKLNLRLPYRMLKEEGVFKRSIRSYPLFCVKFPYQIIKQKVSKASARKPRDR